MRGVALGTATCSSNLKDHLFYDAVAVLENSVGSRLSIVCRTAAPAVTVTSSSSGSSTHKRLSSRDHAQTGSNRRRHAAVMQSFKASEPYGPRWFAGRAFSVSLRIAASLDQFGVLSVSAGQAETPVARHAGSVRPLGQ